MPTNPINIGRFAAKRHHFQNQHVVSNCRHISRVIVLLGMCWGTFKILIVDEKIFNVDPIRFFVPKQLLSCEKRDQPA